MKQSSFDETSTKRSSRALSLILAFLISIVFSLNPISPKVDAAQAVSPCPANTASVTYTFSSPNCIAQYAYTGATQTFVVPAGLTYVDFSVTAGAGGNAANGAGGFTAGGSGQTGGTGGTVTGRLTVSGGSTLNIYVGGQGTSSPAQAGKVIGTGGWNGGGNAWTWDCGSNMRSGTGGGASDIRVGGTALAHRVVVAGGGGGGGSTDCNGNGAFFDTGGAGGSGVNGQGGNGRSTVTYTMFGTGATQSQAGNFNGWSSGGTGNSCSGALGLGGPTAGEQLWGGGGGGGYFGGGCAKSGGGGGGSSWVNLASVTNTTYSSTNTGNGVITLTYLAAPGVSAFTATNATTTNNGFIRGTSISYSVTFTSAVTGFGTEDISISGTSGTSGSWTKTLVSGSGAGPYVFTLANSSAIDGTVTATIDASGVVDSNSNVGAGTSANTTTIDNTAPTASTATTITPSGGSVTANSLNATNNNVTFTGTIVAGQATGGTAEFYIGTTLIGTDSVIALGDTTVTYTPGTASNAALKAAIASGGAVTIVLKDAVGNSSTSSATTLTVDYRLNQAISGLNAISTQTFSTTAIPLTLSASSGLGVTLSTSTPAVCSVSGSTIAMLASGTCTVSADQPGNSSYFAAPTVTQSFTINRASQTITLSPSANFTLAVGSTQNLASTGQLGLGNVTYSVATGGTSCSISGIVLTALAAGTCTINTTIAQDTSYNSATSSTVTVIVKLGQTITFAPISDKPQSNNSLILTGSTSATGISVSYASSTPSVCTVSGVVVTFVSAGTCTIAASQAGDATYLAANAVTQSFRIAANPAAATITSVSTSGAVPGGSAQVTFAPGSANGSTISGYTITATPSGGGAAVTAPCQSSPCLVNGLTPGISYGFTVTTNASVAGTATTVTSANQNSGAILSVQSIGISAPSSVLVGSAPIQITATNGVDPAWTVSLASTTPSVCTITGTTVTFLGTGDCVISGTSPAGTVGGTNYGYATQAVTISVVAPAPVPAPVAPAPTPTPTPTPPITPEPGQSISKLPAPAITTVVTPNSSGANTAKIQITLPPTGEINQVVIVVKDKNKIPIQTLVVDVKPTDETVIREVSGLPIVYAIRTYTANNFGVSADKLPNANVKKNETVIRVNSAGQPILSGTSISNPVFFSANSPVLRKDQLAKLNDVIAHAKSNLGRVLITGFVSYAGKSPTFEQRLSNQRALAVASYLSKQGVNCWIDYSGFGSISKTSNPANRKVEIRFTSNLKPLKG